MVELDSGGGVCFLKDWCVCDEGYVEDRQSDDVFVPVGIAAGCA